MLRKLPKIVLILMVLMVIFSPFMQLDSLDNFPVATGDIELHIISVLFETGMFFVFAGILLSLFPTLRAGLLIPSRTFDGRVQETAAPKAEFASFILPLRI